MLSDTEQNLTLRSIFLKHINIIKKGNAALNGNQNKQIATAVQSRISLNN